MQVVTENSPRVLVVAPRLDLGGAEIHLSRVLPHLRHAGVDVSVFTIQRGGQLEEELAAAGIPVLGITSRGPRLFRALRVMHALRRNISNIQPDVLHCFLPEPYLIGALASIGKRKLKKIMSRRSLATYQSKYPLLAVAERITHRRMTALLANSEAVAEELLKESGQKSKIAIIHSGVDLPETVTIEARADCRARLGIAEHELVIVLVANLISYKGHSDLIKALAGIRLHLGASWRLLLIGRDQGIGPALRREAEALQIASHVVWLGEVPNPQDVLPAADIGVLPSHEEGFSNSLLEKMAFGLPVIATKVGGNTDAVVDEESGLLIEAQAPSELGKAILRLQRDPELRHRLGKAARTRVKEKFSIQMCARRYLNLYYGITCSTQPIAELVDSSNTQFVESLSGFSTSVVRLRS